MLEQEATLLSPRLPHLPNRKTSAQNHRRELGLYRVVSFT